MPHGNKFRLNLRDGSFLFDSTGDILNSGNHSRGNALRFFNDELVAWQENVVKSQDTSGDWVNIVGPDGGNPLFSTSSDGDNAVVISQWQKHLFVVNDNLEYTQKIYPNSSGDLQLRTAGLPALASDPSVAASNTGSDSYLYKFLHKYTYKVGTVEYIDRGSPTDSITLTGTASLDTANDAVITSIPVLSNTANDTAWETSIIEIEIYRTTNGGVNFFLSQTVTNGTTSASDVTTDDDLIDKIVLYTEGGIAKNDIPPFAKSVHIVEETGTAYYVNVKEGSSFQKSRIRQSKPGDPDSCPSQFFSDLGSEIVGVSSVQNRVLAIGVEGAYRLDGVFNAAGVGGIVPAQISDSCTCVSSTSIVQTMDGVFWMGEEYAYWSDGFRVIPLNIEWPLTYKNHVDTEAKKKKIIGRYDQRQRRIYWTVQMDTTNGDNERIYVLHLNAGINTNAAFTYLEGSSDFTVTAIEFNGSILYRVDKSGYVFQHDDSIGTDPKIDTTAADVNDWAERTILWDYETTALNLGSDDFRKVCPWVVVNCKNVSNLALSIKSLNDDSRIIESLKPINHTSNIVWGDATIVWGDETIIWNQLGLIEVQRRFPRKSFRFSFKQMKFENAKVAITNSKVLGTANVDSTALTANLSTTVFPDNIEDYFISFDDDNFTVEYLITGLNTANDTLTFIDSFNSSVNDTAADWVIRGKPKGQKFELISFTLRYAYVGRTQNVYRFSQTGEIA